MAKKKRDKKTEDQSDNMNTQLTSAASDEGFWREMWRQARLAWYLIRSPEVPLYLKLLPVLAVVYVLLPTDFIPDVFPVIGQLDDITALLVGAKVFIELAPQDVVAQYIRATRQGAPPAASGEESGGPEQEDVADQVVIEGDFNVVDRNEKDQAD